MVSPLSNETVVTIVFGIIMTVVGVLGWLDGRRRSRERGTTLHISIAASTCTDADRSSTQAQIPRTLSSQSKSGTLLGTRPTGVIQRQLSKAAVVLGHI